MRLLKLIFCAWLFSCLVSMAQASETFVGQFLYKYKGGNIYRVTVNDGRSMKWECIEGSEKGSTGVERPQRFMVSDEIYFVTWVEKTGINVSQVLDLKHMKVYSTIIDGKNRYVLEGTVAREK